MGRLRYVYRPEPDGPPGGEEEEDEGDGLRVLDFGLASRVWVLGEVWAERQVHPTIFLFWKICRFPSKTADLRRVVLVGAAIIVNVYGLILIFREFLPGDPLPTPVFCRNMAKIVQLLSLPKFRFWGGVIA